MVVECSYATAVAIFALNRIQLATCCKASQFQAKTGKTSRLQQIRATTDHKLSLSNKNILDRRRDWVKGCYPVFVRTFSGCTCFSTQYAVCELHAQVWESDVVQERQNPTSRKITTATLLRKNPRLGSDNPNKRQATPLTSQGFSFPFRVEFAVSR